MFLSATVRTWKSTRTSKDCRRHTWFSKKKPLGWGGGWTTTYALVRWCPTCRPKLRPLLHRSPIVSSCRVGANVRIVCQVPHHHPEKLVLKGARRQQNNPKIRVEQYPSVAPQQEYLGAVRDWPREFYVCSAHPSINPLPPITPCCLQPNIGLGDITWYLLVSMALGFANSKSWALVMLKLGVTTVDIPRYIFAWSLLFTFVNTNSCWLVWIN